MIPRDTLHSQVLYDRMLDYPLREGKGLRPALCVATCRALGGSLEAVLPTAAVLELYHNAFLIHDDVEDGSEQRRGKSTLHRLYGEPIAINVGDAMLALTLQPLLDNMKLIGMGPSLHVMQQVSDMARISSEGQAIELEWIRQGSWDMTDDDYVDMVAKKTARYTFVTPMATGAIVAGGHDVGISRIETLGHHLGVAFQIQDDVLNVTGDEAVYGKEICGDLWEGKRTLLLLHALRSCSAEQRRRALEILERPRQGKGLKNTEDVEFLRELIVRARSAEYAGSVAHEHAAAAAELFRGLSADLRPSVHTELLEKLVDYVVERVR